MNRSQCLIIVVLCAIVLDGCSSCSGNDWITIEKPGELTCGATIQWSELEGEWASVVDPEICGDTPAYELTGRVTRLAEHMVLLADVYSPKDDEWFPMSMGRERELDAQGRFSGYFCIPEADWNERHFRFRAMRGDEKLEECIVIVKH